MGTRAAIDRLTRDGREGSLIEHGLDRARADGQPAFLETGTESNIGLYESLGFQVISQERAPDAGPMIGFMQTSSSTGHPPALDALTFR